MLTSRDDREWWMCRLDSVRQFDGRRRRRRSAQLNVQPLRRDERRVAGQQVVHGGGEGLGRRSVDARYQGLRGRLVDDHEVARDEGAAHLLR